MQTVHPLISVIDLRHLLIQLREQRPDICIRYRMLGEMWVSNFLSVVDITEKNLLLNDEVGHRLIVVNDLSAIMQFEIDKPFNGFQPYFHYEVQPLFNHSLVNAKR
jgi:hypothetical protein